MVDIAPAAVADKKNNKKKFSPKFDDEKQAKKLKKTKRPMGDGEDSTSPNKKAKFDTKAEKKPKSDKKPKTDASDDKKSKKPFKKDGGDKPFKKDGKKPFKKDADGKKSFDKDGKKKFNKNKENKPFVKLNKKETREKQKKDKDTRRKFKQEDVFDIGVKAKAIWEEVRKEETPDQKKDKLINDLHALVAGNIKKIIYAHDTVRVVECLMALGDQVIRDKLFVELKDDILPMTKSKYAHFFVQKMLRYGSKEQKAQILKVMEGHVAKLMKNKTAGYVIETIYNDVASAPQRNAMLQEFLDQGFIHFKEPELRTVPEILEKYPNRRSDCVQNLRRNIEVLIRKGAFNHSLTHTIIYNYMLVAEPKDRSEIIEQLREALVHMAHSREGAYVALMCIWHGTAKDRKAIIKSFKTFMMKTAQEEYGHLVLMGMFDSVDDTKIVGKAVIGELAENLEEMFHNKYCVRVLKYLFGRRDPKYMYKDQLELLEKGDGNEHSKKEAGVRHKELLEVAAPPVLEYIQKCLPSTLYNASLSITLTCVINNSPPSKQLSDVFKVIAKEAVKPFDKGDDAPNIIETGCSQLLLKKLIIKDKERDLAGEETFSSHLVNSLSEVSVESWLSCNRGCFVFVFLLETGIKAIKDGVTKSVKPYSKTVKASDTSGGKQLATLLSS